MRARSVELKFDFSSDIILSLKKGDHGAYRAIYLHFRNPLYQFIYTLIGEEDEAEDITQEVFIAVWEKRDKIDVEKGIKSYLYTIARNTTLKYFEHKKVADKYCSWIKLQPENLDGPDELIVANELELITRLAVGQMPKTQRMVFELNQEGLDNEQIAKKMEITKTSVASHLSKARKDLRNLLDKVMIFF